MTTRKRYNAGVNLGGWLSQYSRYDYEHFDTFITKADIEKIASWGMDHVRLPIDYPVLEDDKNPLVYKERGFKYVTDCINWCKEYGLDIILDLHKAPGYSFDDLDNNTFFEDSQQMERFIRLWEEFSRRYIGERDNVWFELLNEIVLPDSGLWNRLAHKTVERIRAIDKDRKIVVGGNYYNAVHMLKEIELFEDENIIYTFHFYEPLVFTHQKASWAKHVKEYDRNVEYPTVLEVFRDFKEKYPEAVHYDAKLHGLYEGGKEFLRRLLQPAADFVKNTGRTAYCGEFGVIEASSIESNARWHRDVIEILKELNIGRAVWSYKEMSFPMVKADGRVVSEELIKVVSESN